VADAYHLLTLLVPVIMASHKDDIWNKVVPLKVSLFVWRILNGELSSKDNFTRRGMLLKNKYIFQKINLTSRIIESHLGY
jgi:hypothetical protein